MRSLIFSSLILFVAVFSAWAGETVALDNARRAHLAALAHLSGDEVAAEDLKGKVVLVSFFASWCPPCRIEFSHLNELRAEYDTDDVAIIAVNLWENWSTFQDDGARLNRFLLKTEPVFSVVKSDDATGLLFGDVQRIPTVFVWDRAGNPALHFIHEVDAEKTNPTMAELHGAIDGAL